MKVNDINVVSGEKTYLGSIEYYGCNNINNIDYHDLISNIDRLYQ